VTDPDGEVLAVNAGSTSLKVSVIRADGTSQEFPDVETAVSQAEPVAVVHRVVHGGERSGPVIVDDAVADELRALTELAPLHQPAALDALDTLRAALPGVPHVACFDTAFHRTIPPAATTYALPERLRHTVRVYGFHGLSHAWSARRAAEVAPAGRRVVVAHLGGGASVCAVRDGRSVDTSMGFTPLDGLVMATRCGHLDPGALLWLQEHTDEDLLTVLEHESGLRGLAGTDDMREVLRRRANGDDAATLAFDVYQHALQGQVAAMVAALRGLDVLVVTGGVGERCGPVVDALCQAFAWAGVAVAGASSGEDVADGVRELTAPGASVRTLVVHAREDLQMVAEAEHLLG
jgi:acetate kinase